MRDYGECICNIKQKLADAWNMANEAIKKVKVNGTVYSPDGTGTVDLGDISVTEVKASDVDMSDGRDVETAITALDDEVGSETDAGTILNRIAKNETAISDETTARQNEDTALASDIADNATAIADEVTARTDADNTLQTAIDEINGSIATNTANIASNKTEIDANASAIAGKQDALTAGNGIAISDGTISARPAGSLAISSSSGAIVLSVPDFSSAFGSASSITIGSNSTNTIYTTMTGLLITIDITAISSGDISKITYEPNTTGRTGVRIYNHNDSDVTITYTMLKFGSNNGYPMGVRGVVESISGSDIPLTLESDYQQNLLVAQKQDMLTAGDGITIDNGTISNSYDSSIKSISALSGTIGFGETTYDAVDIKTTDVKDSTTNINMFLAGDGISITHPDGYTDAYPIVNNAGVTSIIAGDNITIDNSTGAVTINATANNADDYWKEGTVADFITDMTALNDYTAMGYIRIKSDTQVFAGTTAIPDYFASSGTLTTITETDGAISVSLRVGGGSTATRLFTGMILPVISDRYDYTRRSPPAISSDRLYSDVSINYNDNTYKADIDYRSKIWLTWSSSYNYISTYYYSIGTIINNTNLPVCASTITGSQSNVISSTTEIYYHVGA